MLDAVTSTSEYVDDVAIAAYDGAVTRLLAEPTQWGGLEYVVAIANDAGDVYRIITLEGLGDFVHLAEGLKRLGLVDHFGERPDPTGRFDAFFAPVKIHVSQDLVCSAL